MGLNLCIEKQDLISQQDFAAGMLVYALNTTMTHDQFHCYNKTQFDAFVSKSNRVEDVFHQPLPPNWETQLFYLNNEINIYIPPNAHSISYSIPYCNELLYQMKFDNLKQFVNTDRPIGVPTTKNNLRDANQYLRDANLLTLNELARLAHSFIELITALKNDDITLKTEYVYMHNCTLNDDDVVNILSTLSNFPHLRVLELTNNYIQAGGAASIAKALVQLDHLHHLDLSFNQIGDAGAASLATAVASSKLYFLSLSKNDIGRDGAQAFIENLPAMKLKNLHLKENPKIKADLYPAFSKTISKSSVRNLYFAKAYRHALDIENTKIGGLSVIHFPTGTNIEEIKHSLL